MCKDRAGFLSFFLPYHVAHGILVPQPGIETVPPQKGPLCPSFKLVNFIGDWWRPPKLFSRTLFLCLRVNLNPWLLGSFVFWEQSLHTICLFSNRISFFPLYCKHPFCKAGMNLFGVMLVEYIFSLCYLCFHFGHLFFF